MQPIEMSPTGRTRYQTLTIPCHGDQVRLALVPREDLRFRRLTCKTCTKRWTVAIATAQPREQINTATGHTEICICDEVFVREGFPYREPTLEELRSDRGCWYRHHNVFDWQRLLDLLDSRRRQENRWHQDALRQGTRLLRCTNCGHRSDPCARGWVACLTEAEVDVLCPECISEKRHDERRAGLGSRPVAKPSVSEND